MFFPDPRKLKLPTAAEALPGRSEAMTVSGNTLYPVIPR